MNPNENKVDGQPVLHSETAEAHAKHVWTNYVQPSGFKDVCVMVNAGGNHCVTALIKEFKDKFFR